MFHYSFDGEKREKVTFLYEKSKSLVFHIDKVIKRQIAGKEIITLESPSDIEKPRITE